MCRIAVHSFFDGMLLTWDEVGWKATKGDRAIAFLIFLFSHIIGQGIIGQLAIVYADCCSNV